MLAEQLKVLLASNFAFYLKIQGFHWNVEGRDFAQLHSFFQMLYEDVYSANDTIAEYVRSLNEYSPASLARFQELTRIQDQTKIPRAQLMIEELYQDNETFTQLLNETFDLANSENQQGIANFIAERLSQHGKWGWQLRSFLKEGRS